MKSASAPELEASGRADQAQVPRKPDKNWSQVPLGDTRSCLLPEKQAERAAAKLERDQKMHELLKKELEMKSRSAPNLWELKKFDARSYKKTDYSFGTPSLNSEGLRDTFRAYPAWRLTKSSDWKSDSRATYNPVLHQPSIVGAYDSGIYGGRLARGVFQHQSIYHKVQPEEVSGKPRYLNM